MKHTRLHSAHGDSQHASGFLNGPLVKFTQFDRSSHVWIQFTHSFADEPMAFLSSIKLLGVKALVLDIYWQTARFQFRSLPDRQFSASSVSAESHQSSIGNNASQPR